MISRHRARSYRACPGGCRYPGFPVVQPVVVGALNRGPIDGPHALQERSAGVLGDQKALFHIRFRKLPVALGIRCRTGFSIPATSPATRQVTEETIPMKLTWYGHSAFRIGAGAAKIRIDPFLSDNPSWDKEWIGCRAGEDSTRGGAR